jgi:hypothetical protein
VTISSNDFVVAFAVPERVQVVYCAFSQAGRPVGRGLHAVGAWLSAEVLLGFSEPFDRLANRLIQAVSEMIRLSFVSIRGGCFIWSMALVELVHRQGSYRVSVIPLITTRDLFKSSPGLTISPDRIQCSLSPEDF